MPKVKITTRTIPRTIATFAVFSLLVACANAADRPAAQLADGAIVETRSAMLSSCIMTSADTPKESAFVAGIALALAPAVISAGFEFIGNVLDEAAKDKNTPIKTDATGNFYTPEFEPESGKKTSTYVVTENAKNKCLIVVHGKFSTLATGNTPVYSSDTMYTEAKQDTLYKVFGLVSEPTFYYEGIVKYAPDGSAFKVQTGFIDYRKTLEDGDSDATRSLAVTLSFATPSETASGKAFAAGAILIPSLKTGTMLTQPLTIGSPPAAALKGLSTGLATGWMPLPALGDTTKNFLTVVASRKDSLKDLSDKGVADYKKYFKEDIKTPIEIDISKVKSSRKIKISERDNTKINLAAKSDENETKLRILEFVLEDKVSPPANDAEKAKRAVERHKKLRSDAAEIKRIETSLERIGGTISDLDNLVAAEKAFGKLEERVKNEMDKAKLGVAPFTVTMTITEIRKASKAAKFLANVFTKAQPGLEKAFKNQFDPATRNQLKIQAEADDLKRLQSANTAKVAALDAALTADAAKITLDGLTDTSAIAIQTANAAYEKAKLGAQIKCADAQRLGAEPPQCVSY